MRPGEELTALRLEAGRRGLSYGQLVGLTTSSEQRKIIEKYHREYTRNLRRRGKGEEKP